MWLLIGLCVLWGFPGSTGVKSAPSNAGDAETRAWSLVWEDPLEKGMATHSSILAWTVLCTEEPSVLQPMRLRRVGHGWATVHVGPLPIYGLCLRPTASEGGRRRGRGPALGSWSLKLGSATCQRRLVTPLFLGVVLGADRILSRIKKLSDRIDDVNAWKWCSAQTLPNGLSWFVNHFPFEGTYKARVCFF